MSGGAAVPVGAAGAGVTGAGAGVAGVGAPAAGLAGAAAPRRGRWLVALLALLACVGFGAAVQSALLARWLDGDRQAAGARLDFYARALDATLARHETLPGLLAMERDLAGLLRAPADPARRAAANAYLAASQRHAGLAAAFLIDAGGTTLAASNAGEPRSFVGHNYGFRPYFTEALAGRTGRFYGVGSTTGEPGYFLAAPVTADAQVLGVVVVKLDLAPFERDLRASGDTVLVADADGVVFLAAEPDWRYRSLAPLAAEARARITDTRQYADAPLAALVPGEAFDGSRESVRLPATDAAPARAERLLLARGAGPLGWRVVLLADPRDTWRAATGAGVAAGFALAFALAVGLHLHSRRQRRAELRAADAALETRLAVRTAALRDKVAELERAEALLRGTRDAAVQAGKLAVLGQMSAGVSHELAQPLAALRSFADNGLALIERGRIDDARDNLATIGALVDRMGRIVTGLKAFARKAPDELAPVTLAQVIDNAWLIVAPPARLPRPAIDIDCAPGLQALAEPLRLEQLFINLMRNGLDAMAGQGGARLAIRAEAAPPAVVRITVRDHGPGIAPEALPRLFEPFWTTKPAGVGLGLGLAISAAIVEGFGGRIAARNADGGGAEFIVELPAAGPR